MAMKLTENEPVAVAGTVGVVLSTGVALVSLLGIDLTAEQSAGIIGFGNALIALVVVLWQRARVEPVVKRPHAQRRSKLLR